LQDFDFKLMGISLDAQQVANANLSGRLGGLIVALDPAQIASTCGQSAGLKEPPGPEPFVNSNAGHKGIQALSFC
jgi:hypothetical protein